MTWQPTDCHAHTVLSDGRLTVAELERAVRARGVKPSVSDHLSGDVSYSRQTVEAVREYLDILERHDVLRGGEFCWHDDLWRNLPAEVVSRFTHRIGSLHAIPLANGDRLYAFAAELPAGLAAADWMRLHVGTIEQIATAMPVDILAHPTLLPVPLRAIAPEELWTEEMEDRLVTALARGGIALEVSSRYRPHERLVRRAFDGGVRLSLGSDGHTAAQVGEISFSLALTRAIGVPDEQLYDPLIHGSRTGFDAAAATS